MKKVHGKMLELEDGPKAVPNDPINLFWCVCSFYITYTDNLHEKKKKLQHSSMIS